MVSAVCEPKGDPQQTSSYPNFREVYNFADIEFPVILKDIKIFERNNNVSINVYGIEKFFKNGKYVNEIVGPLHYNPIKKNVHVNLLLVTADDGNNHYCWIKDLNSLVSKQISKMKVRKHLCDGCLQNFGTYEKLKRHSDNDCSYVRIDLPSDNIILDKFGNKMPANILKFQNIQKQYKIPFTIYADFECYLRNVDDGNVDITNSYTKKVAEHVPYSFCYYIKSSFDDNISYLKIYRGTDCAEKFIELIEKDVVSIYHKYLKNKVDMKRLTSNQQKEYENANICHICEKTFSDGNFLKCRDHCHITGEYRGSAHVICNLFYQIPRQIPVVLHCLKNYDSHLFIKSLGKNKENIHVIPQNKEKYISFSKEIVVDYHAERKIAFRLSFIDSFQFLPESLDSLSKTLEDSQCLEIKKHFKSKNKFQYIRQKGVFPYSYIDSYEKLNEVSLPSRDKFYNNIIDENISGEDYERAISVWKLFNCSTLGEYSDIYLKSDVLLLADIFENYRRICLNTYKLDPVNYVSSPSMCWDAMMKLSNVELELITDPDMLHFFKKGIRGGVSSCISRKSEANNPFLNTFNPNIPTTYIAYLDATNLYGYAMSQYLPQKDFSWVSDDEIKSIEISKVSDNADIGYVFEVDLEYPENLHDDHNDLPLCPEQMTPPISKYPKLIPNLNNKYNYVIHYRNLKQCLELGLKILKIHRGVKFFQSPWLKSYIDLNTKLRNAAKNKFDKNSYKLAVNSIYGKTMENVEKRVDVKLVTQWERSGKKLCAERLIAKPQFKDLKIFSENLVAIQLQKICITYDKPIYVGMCVLDISKTVMYDFYYGHLKKIYANNISLLYTDTDSLILEIQTDNFYEDMKQNLVKFDTSNYPTPNIHNMPITTSVVGKFKDEYCGIPIESFYGTGAKAYCIKTKNSLDKKAKGISKSTIKKQLDLSLYKHVVEKNDKIYITMYVFKSDMHNVYTNLISKIALSSHDDKRFLLSSTTKTLAWGHRDIPAIESMINTLEALLMENEGETKNKKPRLTLPANC